MDRYFVLSSTDSALYRYMTPVAAAEQSGKTRVYALADVAHITIDGSGPCGLSVEFRAQSQAEAPNADSWGVLSLRAASSSERDRWVLGLRAAVAAARRAAGLSPGSLGSPATPTTPVRGSPEAVIPLGSLDTTP